MAWEKKRPVGLGGQRAAEAVDESSRYPKDIAKALRLARKMSPIQCVDWVDSSLSSIGRNLIDHQRDPARTGDHLRAALSDAAALYACLVVAVDSQPVPAVSVAPGSVAGVASMRQG